MDFIRCPKLDRKYAFEITSIIIFASLTCHTHNWENCLNVWIFCFAKGFCRAFCWENSHDLDHSRWEKDISQSKKKRMSYSTNTLAQSHIVYLCCSEFPAKNQQMCWHNINNPNQLPFYFPIFGVNVFGPNFENSFWPNFRLFLAIFLYFSMVFFVLLSSILTINCWPNYWDFGALFVFFMFLGSI